MTDSGNNRPTFKKALPYVYIIAGIIGLVASFALIHDKIQVLKNPAYIPSCNISPILSCGSVMDTEQANLLGVPNPVFGLIAFSMLLALGVVLSAGAAFGRWLWRTINAAALAGFVFFLYLFLSRFFGCIQSVLTVLPSGW